MWANIESWTDSIELFSDTTMPQTPVNKRLRSGDDDQTPTQRVTGISGINDVSGISGISDISGGGSEPSLGRSSDYGSTASSTGRPTKRALSPKKREVVLRQAKSFPVRRQRIASMTNPSHFMRQLAEIGQTPVMPSYLRPRIEKDSDWANQPRDAWFFEGTVTSRPAEDAVYMHRRILQIQDNTIKAEQRMAHEVEWNEAVHWPLLELALDDSPTAGVICRNVTQCAVYPELREPDPRIMDTKSDYALCLDPERGSRLACLLRAYRQSGEDRRTSHIQFSDEANTPPVIGIETKAGSGGDHSTQGSAQSASFVRAQYRHLVQLPNGAARPLPRLPMVHVIGSRWYVDFATRTESETVIYERLDIGSSDNIHGCYVICAAIASLARWCAEEYGPWLDTALSLPGDPAAGQPGCLRQHMG